MALETLNQLHQQNVLHNDLRFENFLINNDNHSHQHNRIMLCDFGNALILNEKDEKNKKLFLKEENQLKKLPHYTEEKY
jgi:serine/threonine protein kinase